MSAVLRLALLVLLAGAATNWFITKQGNLAVLGQRPALQGAGEQSTETSTEVWPDQPARSLRLKPGPNGHFYLDLLVNGARVPFLVDTGASSVVLTKEAARRARINPNRLDYTHRAHTANGTIRIAPVEVREMRVGQLRMGQVDAVVNEAPMQMSLLGMSFLSRLRGYEVKDKEFYLYW